MDDRDKRAHDAAPQPGSWGRRVLALALDWLVANLLVLVIVRSSAPWQAPFTGVDALPLVAFAVEMWLLSGFLSASLGHRLCGLAVIDQDGRRPGPLRAAVRTALILLVIPPLVADDNGRGLHDRAAGTFLVRVPRSDSAASARR